MSIADEVIAAIEAVAGESNVGSNRDVNLFDHQILDSLRTIELIVEMSERFGVDIALSEVDRDVWATPNRIVAFMEQRLPA